MAGFQNAAMTRADSARENRRPFYLYADEYATFVNRSFADTLAQARKYGLYLTAAQQIISQVDEEIMQAMFGNLATLVSFQVAQEDAERLSAELVGQATPADLMQLPKYHAIVRTLIDGVPSCPFVVMTLPPPPAKRIYADPNTIRRVLSRRYGSPIAAA
jgi:type IV secretory pathway TraG/TraD family ATPase VirD4